MIFFVCLFFTAAGLICGSFSHSIGVAFESGFFLNTGNPECFFAELKKPLDCSCKWCIFEYHCQKQYGESLVFAFISLAACLSTLYSWYWHINWHCSVDKICFPNYIAYCDSRSMWCQNPNEVTETFFFVLGTGKVLFLSALWCNWNF